MKMQRFLRDDKELPNLGRFYVTSNVKPVHEFAVPSTFSDHDVITLEIENFTTLLRGPGFWKNNTSIYDKQAFLDILANRWNLWETLELTLFSNKVDWWSHVKGKFPLLVQISLQNHQPSSKKRGK